MERLLQIGLENALAAGILGLVVFGVGRLRRQPPLIHLLWVVVLLKLLLPPLLVPPFSWTGAPGSEARPLELPPPAPPPSISSPAPAGTERGGPDESRGEASPALVTAARLPPASSLSLLDAGVWLWILGSAAMLAVAVVRTGRFQLLLRSAGAAPGDVQQETASLASRLGISRPPRVLLLASSLSPALWVMGRTRRIVFPLALWDRLGAVERRALLAHELAHLRRRDHWVRWLELAATVLYWWHPVVWWARREIEKHEEACCDAWVLWALPEAQGAYGRALVETVEFISGGSRPLPALASGMAGAGEIQRRLTTILTGSSPRLVSRIGWAVLAGAGALALLHVPVHAVPEEAAAPAGAPQAAGAGNEKKPETPPGPRSLAAAAARRGLDWLLRHQSPDGSWKAADFIRQCKTPCRNANPARHGEGHGRRQFDVGVTALAMLAFAGHGHTHRDGVLPEYVECLQKAVAYMKTAQVRKEEPKGCYGPGTGEQWVYDHAIATMAMGKLLVMSNDVIGLKRSVTDAVKLCLRAQNDGFAWRYGIKPGDNDSSVTAWMVQALILSRQFEKQMRGEPLQNDFVIESTSYLESFEGARRWFDRATASNGVTGYMVPGDQGSRFAQVHPEPYPFSKDLPVMTAAAVGCSLLVGEDRQARRVRLGADLIARHLPAWQEKEGGNLSTINFYYWYFGTLALSRLGGPEFRRWQEEVDRVLTASQRQESGADEEGSWDPVDEWGPAGGRVYSTALAVMTLAIGPGE